MVGEKTRSSKLKNQKHIKKIEIGRAHMLDENAPDHALEVGIRINPRKANIFSGVFSANRPPANGGGMQTPQFRISHYSLRSKI